jgi:hypothetical protein
MKTRRGFAKRVLHIKRARRARGFSLLDVLLAVVLIAIITLGMFSVFASSYTTLAEARMLEMAKTLAQLKVEEKMGSPTITPGTEAGTFAGLPGFSWTTLVVFEGGSRVCITVTIGYGGPTGAKQYKMVGWRGV